VKGKGVRSLDRDLAIAQTQKKIAETFVVTNVVAFADKSEEDNSLVRLKDAGEVGVPEGDEHIEGDIFYVTMSFDSVVGDGDFRATTRVTDEGTEIVDFEAGELG
jgi:hypothetical protein